MLASLLVAPVIRVLFVGNSLLNFNDVPATVARMLESDGSGRKVAFKSFFVGHLEDVSQGSETDRAVTGGGYDIVVLQAAMVSSSMTRTYAQNRAIGMAKAAKAGRSRVLLYVEWPRRGIDETEYTMNVYRGIAKASGAEIVPVCYVWNKVASRSSEPLWARDGNHALTAGSFVAAATTYFHIAGTDRTPTYRPKEIPLAFAQLALSIARKINQAL